MSEAEGPNPAPSKEPVQFPLRLSPPPPPETSVDRPLWQTGALVALIAIVAVFGELEFRSRWQIQIAVPANGRLMLAVFPSAGAQVMVDGDPMIAVTAFLDLSPGQHRLSFSAPGYSPELVMAVVQSGRQQDVSVTLKRLSGKPVAPRVPPARNSAAPSVPAAKSAA